MAVPVWSFQGRDIELLKGFRLKSNCIQMNAPYRKTSPKGISTFMCDVRNWIFLKSWEFLGEFFGNFWGFFGEFLRNSLGILWEYEWNLFVCQDFVSMDKEGGRKDKKFRPLSHLKMKIVEHR